MADKKISELAALGGVPADGDVLPIVNSGVTKKVTSSELVKQNADVAANTTHRGLTNNPHSVIANQVEIPEIGTATYDDLQDFVNQYGSAGYISGFTVSDGGSGTADIAAGTGFLRTTDSANGAIVSFDYAGTSGLALTDNNTNWIYIDYNAGTPQAAATTDITSVNLNTEIVIGRVYRSGNDVTIITVGQNLANYRTSACYRDFEVDGITRASGLILGETGTRNVTTTAGVLYCAHNRTAISAIDTSGADTFDVWNSSASTSADATGQSQYDNAQYWNGAALASLTTNRYGTRFFYLDFGGSLHMQYGVSNTVSAATAENEAVPTPPAYLRDFAIYIGRIVIQDGGSSAEVITSAFLQAESGSVVTDHTDLASIGTNTHAQIDKVVSEQTRSFSLENPSASDDISWTLFTQAVTITEIRAVLVGSDTPSVTWTIRHGTDRSAAGAEVVTGGSTTTSVTTGDTITSFNDATIVADSWVWIETTAQSGTVNFINLVITFTID